MAEFRLPKNSRLTEGKTWPAPDSATLREFRIYRYDPDTGANPRIDTYFVDTSACGPVVLDEYRRRQRARLHDRHGCAQGRDRRLSLAAHAGGEGPRPRPHDVLCAAPLDRAVAENHDTAARDRVAAIEG